MTGILGAILFAVVLLAVGITATSVVSAILIGLLVASLTLTFAGSAWSYAWLTAKTKSIDRSRERHLPVPLTSQ